MAVVWVLEIHDQRIHNHQLTIFFQGHRNLLFQGIRRKAVIAVYKSQIIACSIAQAKIPCAADASVFF